MLLGRLVIVTMGVDLDVNPALAVGEKK